MKRPNATMAMTCLSLLLSATAAHSLCPLNQGQIGVLQNCGSPQSRAPVFSASQSPTPGSSECINGTGTVSYDLPAGTFGVTARSFSHEGFQTWLQTSDDFVIVGPPAATPIPISAIFTGSWYRAEVRITSGPDVVGAWGDGSPIQTLRLDLLPLPGQTFSVSVYGSAHASPNTGTAQVQGTLRFTALAPGYALSSCQGYAVLPVATRPTSWGRLKQIYR